MVTINGTELNDNLIGTSGDDLIFGLDGNDTLTGGAGFDNLVGGNGDDILTDSANGGLFQGGPGNDQLIGSASLDDIVLYTFTYNTSGVTFVSTFVPGIATSTQADGLGGVDTLSNIDRVDIMGSQHGDNLTGDAGANSIFGYAGNDTLSGGAGNDYLNGDDGDDTAIFSGLAAEYVVTYQSATAEYTITDSQAGRDGTDTISEIESLKFSDGIKTPASLLQGNAPTYILSPSASSVNEGASLTYTLNTTNVTTGTVLNYTLSGVSAADIVGGALTGSVTVAATGVTTFTVALVADSLTEVAETLVAQVGSTSGVALATASGVIVNDTSLPTTRIFLGTGNTFTAGDNNLTVTGAAGTKIDTVHINAGMTGIKMDANIERVEVPGALSDYSFLAVAGTGVQIQAVSNGAVIATIPSLNQNATLAFANGSASLVQTGGSSFSLGGQTIATGSASSFATASLSGFNGADTSTLGTLPGTATTRAFIGSGNTFTAGDNNIAVTGASGTAIDTVRIQTGVTGIKMDANIERVELAGSLSDFKFMTVAGAGTQIQLATSGAAVATIPSLNQTATLAFTNGSASLVQTGGSSFSLGGQAIGTASASSFSTGSLIGFNGADTSTLGAVTALSPFKVMLQFGVTGVPSTQTITISDAQAATVTQFSIVLDSADNTQDVTLTNAAIAATNGATLAAAIQTQLRAAVPFTYTEATYAAGVITISEWAGRAISGTSLKATSSTSVGTVSAAINGIESTLSDSYVGAYDTIASFTVGKDKIDLLNSAGNAISAPTALTRFADVDGALVTTHQELINQVFNSSSFSNTGANKAGMIVVTTGAYAGNYLFINDSVPALDSGIDLFVKLVGTTGLGNVGTLTVSDYFA